VSPSLATAESVHESLFIQVMSLMYSHSEQQICSEAAQESGGVTSLGGVKKICRYGTSGHGLVGMVVMGWQLDLMILEVFSNLYDSMIYDSMI